MISYPYYIQRNRKKNWFKTRMHRHKYALMFANVQHAGSEAYKTFKPDRTSIVVVDGFAHRVACRKTGSHTLCFALLCVYCMWFGLCVCNNCVWLLRSRNRESCDTPRNDKLPKHMNCTERQQTTERRHRQRKATFANITIISNNKTHPNISIAAHPTSPISWTHADCLAW